MEQYEDIYNIIELLDNRMGAAGISRINLHVDNTAEEGTVQERYHHGRCDVGSPWANGTVGNVEFGDGNSCG